MRGFYKTLIVTSFCLIPATCFSSEKAAPMKSESFGYYDLNIGDYSAPEQHHDLPKEGNGHIEVNLDRNFSITFPDNPSTGASWGLRILPAELMFLSSSHKPSDKCGVANNEGVPLVGCGGFTTYIFKALEKGTGTIKFEYGQQWRKDAKTVITVKVTVK
ncbi:protease inhibitor I42 family protein [Chromobacterium haemolyticum]|uniref:protease inhibitor I42 family protein n=1 Tax=Chromobacterium TaxID=535 RepID=UPI0018879151|nr:MULTISPECIES: protease inhibitor I42 family protein [Chromobacterium]QOZ83577.1 hypothetical protein DXT74_11145 [Chromobacterium sp. Rain0013]UGA36966.1 protease inhibitor I42 family protein [Chromobacterium haemolyticum]WON83694.1 protease inhibitor I42 family protein [Chromobacterium haemolyticum]